MQLNELLGDPAWLFDLGFPMLQFGGHVKNPAELQWELQVEYAIPAFSSISGGKRFAEARMAWSSHGLFFHSIIQSDSSKTASAKTSPLRPSLLSIYIDTRWSPGVHRANSFCHRFDCILNRPTSALPVSRAHGELSPIQRARSAPADIHPKDISVATFFNPQGYEIKAYLNGSSLTGYSPEEFQELGVFYTINDSALGNQVMARTLQSPYFEDPSVWCRTKLIPFTT